MSVWSWLFSYLHGFRNHLFVLVSCRAVVEELIRVNTHLWPTMITTKNHNIMSSHRIKFPEFQFRDKAEARKMNVLAPRYTEI